MLSGTSSKGSYYKAHVDESVIDVMEGITADLNADVALVFEGEELRGLFTDSDYIKVCVRVAVFYAMDWLLFEFLMQCQVSNRASIQYSTLWIFI